MLGLESTLLVSNATINISISNILQANGFKYVGDYENDKKHGRGKYTYPNGDIYNGNWKNGVRDGKGKYSYKEDEGV